MKKILFLLALILMLCLVSCGKNETPPENTIDIPFSDLADYSVVRGDLADDTLTKLTTEIRTELSERTGQKLGIATDWVMRGEEPPTDTKEILIGTTNRAESIRVSGELRNRDWALGYENGRIIVWGADAEHARMAYEELLGRIDTKAGVIRMPESMLKVSAEYECPDLKIAGADAGDYQIAYTSSGFAKDLAEKIAAEFSGLTGYDFRAVSVPYGAADEDRGKMICVTSAVTKFGVDLRNKDYYIGAAGNTMYIAALSEEKAAEAYTQYKTMLDTTKGTLTFPENPILSRGDYYAESVLLNGRELYGYRIVCEEESEEAANAAAAFSETVRVLYGMSPANPGDTAPAIIFGGAEHGENEGVFSLSGENIVIAAAEGMYEDTVRVFLAELLGGRDVPQLKNVVCEYTVADKVTVTAETVKAYPERTVYVSENGSDDAPGTKDSPVKTVSAAIRLAAEWYRFSPAHVSFDISDSCYLLRDVSVTEKTLGADFDKKKAESAKNEYLPGVICWGDSLTARRDGWPLTLQTLLNNNVYPGLSVVNMGIGGEGSNTIVGRSGAIPFVVKKAFTIPADRTPVEMEMMSEDGRGVNCLRQGDSGMESVTIAGVTGYITCEQEDIWATEWQYFFRRDTAGEAVQVPANTVIEVAGAKRNPEYFPIIFIGQNGGYSDFDDLISQQRAVADHCTGKKDRFLIIGLHTKTAAERADLEAAMEKEYGRQYINLREYMSTYAIFDLGIEPDREAVLQMAEGRTPECLMTDGCHFTLDAYGMIGRLVYTRMEELGYFDEIRAAG